MPHRAYIDSLGRHWDVWSVHPEYAERRRTPSESSMPVLPERRARNTFRVPLGRTWAAGWLVFETKGEKRRLAPFPPNWTELSDAQLDRLREQAVIATTTRRLIE